MRHKVLFITDGCNFKIGKGKVSESNYRIICDVFEAENVFLVTIGKRNSVINDFGSSAIHLSKNSKRSFFGKSLSSINSLLKSYPVGVDESQLKEIQEFVVFHEINILFLDDSYFGGLADNLHGTKFKVITFFHDIRRSLILNWLWNSSLSSIPFLLQTLINERVAVKRSDVIITLNSRDSSHLVKHYDKMPSLELPVILRDDFELSHENILFKEDFVLFVGAFYHPNVKGVKWFIKNVLPEIHINRILIVGFQMEKIKYELESMNSKVEVVGTVSTLSPYYKNARIVVEPIFEGGGMKVKTAEALMYGKSIIGSKEALEGYDVSQLEYVKECNSKEEYINAFNVYRNTPKYIEQNRAFFLKEFSYSSGLTRIKNVILKSL